MNHNAENILGNNGNIGGSNEHVGGSGSQNDQHPYQLNMHHLNNNSPMDMRGRLSTRRIGGGAGLKDQFE